MKKIDRFFTVTGLLLLAAALLLALYNIRTQKTADEAAENTVEQLEPLIEESKSKSAQTADGSSEEVLPDYVLNPEMDMPEQTVDGNAYIGILEIPSLDLSLPVMSEWSYPGLAVSPCRYCGSAYLNDMVIAAHNFDYHFGCIKTLSPGDEVTFTDIDGNVFRYEVAEIETLQPTDVEALTDSDWDLTLFTCTIGGASRVTVRCART